MSGAFVRTETGLDLLASVRILIADPVPSSSRPIDPSGYVVRRDRSGVGLEWWNFSSEDLQLLL